MCEHGCCFCYCYERLAVVLLLLERGGDCICLVAARKLGYCCCCSSQCAGARGRLTLGIGGRGLEVPLYQRQINYVVGADSMASQVGDNDEEGDRADLNVVEINLARFDVIKRRDQ